MSPAHLKAEAVFTADGPGTKQIVHHLDLDEVSDLGCDRRGTNSRERAGRVITPIRQPDADVVLDPVVECIRLDLRGGPDIGNDVRVRCSREIGLSRDLQPAYLGGVHSSVGIEGLAQELGSSVLEVTGRIECVLRELGQRGHPLLERQLHPNIVTW